MKLFKMGSILLIAALAVAGQVQAQSFLTNGLVAYYPFNGNANDASGNGFDCTNFNVTMASDRFGAPSSSALFDGSSSYLEMSAALAQRVSGSGPLTVSVWMKIAPAFTNIGNMVLVEFGQPSNDTSFIVAMKQGQFAYSEWGPDYNSTSGTFIGDDQWHQGVCSFDGSEVALYVDGAFRGKQAMVSNRSPWAGVIGGRFDLCCEFWKGGLDDVRIYSRAFSSNEVQQLYQYESAPPCVPAPPGLVGWWPGDGNADDIASGYNGALTNGAAFAAGEVGQASVSPTIMLASWWATPLTYSCRILQSRRGCNAEAPVL